MQSEFYKFDSFNHSLIKFFEPLMETNFTSYKDRNLLFYKFFVWLQGRCIFSSGSPFPPVEFNGKTYTPGQGNNAYIFPGVALGVIATGIHHITEELFLIAAQVFIRILTTSLIIHLVAWVKLKYYLFNHYFLLFQIMDA